MGIYPRDPFTINAEFCDLTSRLYLQWKISGSGKLDKKSSDILDYFAEHPTGSTYQCYKYMNNQKGTKISYKNVYKKLQNLYEFGYVKKVSKADPSGTEEPRSKHGAIYYKLSHYGIFHILKESDPKFDLNLLISQGVIIFDFENFELYKNILYPFVRLQTLKQLNSILVINTVFTYLQRCCKNLENIYIEIEKYHSFPLDKHIDLIVSTSRHSLDISMKRFQVHQSSTLDKQIGYLPVSELTRGSRIPIEFSTQDLILYFRLNVAKNELEVYEEGKKDPTIKVIKFDYKELENPSTKIYIFIVNLRQIIEGYLKKIFVQQLSDDVNNFCLDIINLTDPYIELEVKRALLPDLMLLKNDGNFSNIVYAVKRHLDNIYTDFVNLTF